MTKNIPTVILSCENCGERLATTRGGHLPRHHQGRCAGVDARARVAEYLRAMAATYGRAITGAREDHERKLTHLEEKRREALASAERIDAILASEAAS